MKVQKSLEKPTRILGMRMQELGLYVCLLIGLITLASLARTIVPVPRAVYAVILILLVLSWLVLRWGERHKHPSFLISMISWAWLQPKQVNHVTIKFRGKDGQLRRNISRLQHRR
ncbi:hypothetical protein EQG79_28630 [Spirosoma sordidisoli]|uniref:Uncharacterized protein n=1 Tax=Spirosoma sordidisoli TaxID=2502893 RepID=A0A4Q2UBW3_9BACT|nr:hypothetical protein EQG79_28630 [Spirosoma sordidisoli]